MELGLWILTLLALSVKDKRKKKVSAKLKSRPRQILLGNSVLETLTILSNFSDSEQFFEE